MRKMVGFLLIIGVITFASASVFGHAEPGPSFEGWANGGAVAGWHSQHLTRHSYVDQTKQPREIGMRGVWVPTGEVVVKGWGMTFDEGYHLENAQVALKLEDGTWVVGKKGTMFRVADASGEKDSPLVVFYILTDDNREIERAFPK